MKLFAFSFLFLIVSFLPVSGQVGNLPVTITDTLPKPPLSIHNNYTATIEALLGKNNFINSKGIPVAMPIKLKKQINKDAYFYLLSGLVLLLALLKFFYARYFATLFRVFFNTSLRQPQLTDQLLQSKLPSLFFNGFFIIAGGVYIYFLLRHFNFVTQTQPWMIMGICIISLALIYVVKYLSLKFTGWLTGYKQPVSIYVFVIFLICKIMGVVLIPFTIIIIFGNADVASGAAIVSVVFICALLLLRFFRSYGLLQNQLKISGFHFLLYIAGVEVIPLLLIYKGLLILLNKNH